MHLYLQRKWGPFWKWVDFPPWCPHPKPFSSLSLFMPSAFYTNTHFPVGSSDTMARCLALHRGLSGLRCASPRGYHFCSGPGHWPQLKSAQQLRTAKVSGRVLTAGARRLSNLNRNDRSTGKAAGMPGGTNKHRRGVGPGRNRWWNHLQGYCHVTFHPGEVLGL